MFVEVIGIMIAAKDEDYRLYQMHESSVEYKSGGDYSGSWTSDRN